MNRLILIACCIFGLHSSAQILDNNHLVQFSGVIVTFDSLKPIPFSSIMIKNTNRGTVSDYYGFFSFVAKMKDTIEFTALVFLIIILEKGIGFKLSKVTMTPENWTRWLLSRIWAEECSPKMQHAIRIKRFILLN